MEPGRSAGDRRRTCIRAEDHRSLTSLGSVLASETGRSHLPRHPHHLSGPQRHWPTPNPLPLPERYRPPGSGFQQELEQTMGQSWKPGSTRWGCTRMAHPRRGMRGRRRSFRPMRHSRPKWRPTRRPGRTRQQHQAKPPPSQGCTASACCPAGRRRRRGHRSEPASEADPDRA
jgi:hypothetical protein